MVHIYFDTSTFDQIERDVKVRFFNKTWLKRMHVATNVQVTLESALGLIGGTMGLLTGFSILSGIEIIYYVIKFFLSLRVKIELRSKNKNQNHLF